MACGIHPFLDTTHPFKYTLSIHILYNTPLSCKFNYPVGMWRMLQVDEPDDYVLATNETHAVREFIERAFSFIGTTIEWQGEFGTVNEIGM